MMIAIAVSPTAIIERSVFIGGYFDPLPAWVSSKGVHYNDVRDSITNACPAPATVKNHPLGKFQPNVKAFLLLRPK